MLRQDGLEMDTSHSSTEFPRPGTRLRDRDVMKRVRKVREARAQGKGSTGARSGKHQCKVREVQSGQRKKHRCVTRSSERVETEGVRPSTKR